MEKRELTAPDFFRLHQLLRPRQKNVYGNINYWSEHTYKKLTGECVFSTSYSYFSVFHFWSILVEMPRKSSVTTYNPPYRSDKLSIFKIQVFAYLSNIFGEDTKNKLLKISKIYRSSAALLFSKSIYFRKIWVSRLWNWHMFSGKSFWEIVDKLFFLQLK